MKHFARALALLSIAALARLPRINLPVGTLDGRQSGLSLNGPRGFDRGLLEWTRAILHDAVGLILCRVSPSSEMAASST
jgi:Asp-tRNA(Asn)/Glu-tRNA(Gln) amidotransferase A subunit family amidase